MGNSNTDIQSNKSSGSPNSRKRPAPSPSSSSSSPVSFHPPSSISRKGSKDKLIVRTTSPNLEDVNNENDKISPSASSISSNSAPALTTVSSTEGSTTAVAVTTNTTQSQIKNSTTVAATASVANADSSSTVEENVHADTRTSKDYYFDSYAHHGIHEEMLKDEVRTRTYQMAIEQNAFLFQNKVVLDVGCGTGILSMFAARAGAKHVIGVDHSSIIEQARDIVKSNGFSSDQITLIKGKMEDIELPVKEVDIIISEWMGYFLLYESMLDTVLFARDKYLRKDGNGIIFPDKATMYICGIEDAQIRNERIGFWDNVYGFNMSSIKKLAMKEPVVDVIDSKAVVTNCVPILHLDILTCTKEDLEFTAKFKLSCMRHDYIHAFVSYFEVAFTQTHKPLGFSTSPFARYTHWKQTIFYLHNQSIKRIEDDQKSNGLEDRKEDQSLSVAPLEMLTVCQDDEIYGEISCKPNSRNNRDLDISIGLNLMGLTHQRQYQQFNNSTGTVPAAISIKTATTATENRISEQKQQKAIVEEGDYPSYQIKMDYRLR